MVFLEGFSQFRTLLRYLLWKESIVLSILSINVYSSLSCRSAPVIQALKTLSLILVRGVFTVEDAVNCFIFLNN